MAKKSAPANLAIFTQVCRTFRLPDPVAEFQFHPDRKWRVDFYFVCETNGRRVALEVEGGIHTGGRHTNPTGFKGDMEKYNALSMMGIFLVRVTPDSLMDVATFTTIKKVLYGEHG
jgi:hypothetical protein